MSRKHCTLAHRSKCRCLLRHTRDMQQQYQKQQQKQYQKQQQKQYQKQQQKQYQKQYQKQQQNLEETIRIGQGGSTQRAFGRVLRCLESGCLAGRHPPISDTMKIPFVF
uniref:Uncharacterized protein n=1 Tax=Globodera rostochiensis TaxID=31243 RepID=A0A914H1V7_GLORO